MWVRNDTCMSCLCPGCGTAVVSGGIVLLVCLGACKGGRSYPRYNFWGRYPASHLLELLVRHWGICAPIRGWCYISVWNQMAPPVVGDLGPLVFRMPVRLLLLQSNFVGVFLYRCLGLSFPVLASVVWVLSQICQQISAGPCASPVRLGEWLCNLLFGKLEDK